MVPTCLWSFKNQKIDNILQSKFPCIWTSEDTLIWFPSGKGVAAILAKNIGPNFAFAEKDIKNTDFQWGKYYNIQIHDRTVSQVESQQSND